MTGPKFWLSLPFVLPQAMRVRRTAPRFAAAAGPTSGRVGSGEVRTLLALGDSIIAGVGARQLSNALVGQTARHLADSENTAVNWQAYGHIGITTEGFLQRYSNGLPETDADFVIISLGVNDVTSLTTTRRWRGALSDMLQRCRESYPKAKIALAGLPPMGVFPVLPQPMRALIGSRAEAFDCIAQATANDAKARGAVVHVPIDFNPGAGRFSADGFHPSEASYVDYGRSMAEALLAA